MRTLNERLARVGGSARYVKNEYSIELTFCEGHSLFIDSRLYHPTAKTSGFAYVNLRVHVPGCHEEFDGVLGQTYKCSLNAKDAFLFEEADEDSFVVPSLHSSFGAFNATASCDNASQRYSKLSPMKGGTIVE